MTSARLTIFFALLLTLTSPVFAQESKDWLTNYYRKPTPEKLVDQVAKYGRRGYLADGQKSQILCAFLSRLMAARPGRIHDWMRRLDGLPQEDKKTLTCAVWLSNTVQGNAYLKKHGYKDLLSQEPLDLLSMEPDEPIILDMLWAYFFATGEGAPVRRIVYALNYAKYSGSIDAYKGSQDSEEALKNADREAAFKSALWSLTSNMNQHQRVADICDTVFRTDENLSEAERHWLGIAMSKVKPESDAGADEKKKQEASTTKGTKATKKR